jgi:hypothetical protein
MPTKFKKAAKPAKVGANTKTAKYYVVIVELDTKLRARDKTKPHLYIGMSKTPPEDWLEKFKGPGTAGSDYARGHYVKIYEASPYAKPRTSADVARRRCDEQIEKYIRRGHFVNNGEKFHVYVVDLKQDHLEIMPKSGYVYVGRTSKTPEERFKQHMGGKPLEGKDRRSKVVKRLGIRLSYDLMPKSVSTETQSIQLEKDWAKRLKDRGYRVEAGDATPDRKTKK